MSSLHCWLDSRVAFYWIKGGGEYKQLMANCVRKTKEHAGVIWRHISTQDNAEDLVSRGGLVTEDYGEDYGEEDQTGLVIP